jgi:hypothetical protein
VRSQYIACSRSNWAADAYIGESKRNGCERQSLKEFQETQGYDRHDGDTYILFHETVDSAFGWRYNRSSQGSEEESENEGLMYFNGAADAVFDM